MWRTILTKMSDEKDWVQKHYEVTQMIAEGWTIQLSQIVTDGTGVIAFYYLTKIDPVSAKASEHV